MKGQSVKHMKKLSKSLLAALFACMLFLSIPMGVFADDEEDLTPPGIKDHLPYYYNQMTKEEQSQYIAIRRAVIGRRKSIVVNANDFSEEFMDVIHTIMIYSDSLTFDYQGYSWRSEGYKRNGVYKPDNYTITFHYRDYAMSKDNYARAYNFVDKKVDKFIESLDEDLNTTQKLVAAYDFVREGTVYDLDYKYCHTPYGALIAGQSVCDGYAYAIQFICEKLGIPCVMVHGTTDDPNITHAWNKVKIGKNWYNLDATEGDDETHFSSISEKGNLFLADSEYKSAYQIDDEGIEEPEALDTEHSYYEMTNKSFSDYNSAIKYVSGELKGGLPKYIEMQITDKAVYKKFVNGDFFESVKATGVFTQRKSISYEWYYWDDNGTILLYFTYV
jgi:hypothetical protein